MLKLYTPHYNHKIYFCQASRSVFCIFDNFLLFLNFSYIIGTVLRVGAGRIRLTPQVLAFFIDICDGQLCMKISL